MTTQNHFVIGASAAIAQSFIDRLHHQDPSSHVYTISQQNIEAHHHNRTHIVSEYNEDSIAHTVKMLKTPLQHAATITIFNGQLHNQEFTPEKRLEDISESYFDWIFKANTLTPILWLKMLAPHLSKIRHPCVVTSLSARVASINENELGGWYCYRASKAALNMMFKTASIEYKRRAKTTKLVLFHPGTTDSPLSKPFQKNVPQGKLFTPEFVAERLYDLIQTRVIDGQLDYIDWQGQTISW
jgi:NAD(P)-dependent dehydrogenase (short-subunit alcohol dehydrogenase family)